MCFRPPQIASALQVNKYISAEAEPVEQAWKVAETL